MSSRKPFTLFSREVFEPASRLELILTIPLQYLITTVYRIFNSLHSRSAPPRNPITVVCISDTHTLTCNVPDGDLLIHAGDLTTTGTVAELQAHIDWLASLPHRHKVVIAGNHDSYLDPRSRATLAAADRAGPLDWKRLHYLQHSAVRLTFPTPDRDDGAVDYFSPRPTPRTLTVYGAPQIPRCGGDDFAFQYGPLLDAWTGTVPAGVDVLVTHTPPQFHLDLAAPALGCWHLLRETWRVRPRLHVFGHVHAAAGREVVRWDDAQRVYERAMARPVGKGLVRQLLCVRLWLDAAFLLLYGVTGLAWEKVWGGVQRETVLVNAALMYQHTNVLGNEIQVVAL
jgi:hypothetical protein